MDTSEKELLDRTYRLARENNQMLHKMRRSAFLWGVLKIVIWAAALGLPIWFYLNYVAPVFDGLSESGSQFGAMFQQFSAYFGGGE